MTEKHYRIPRVTVEGRRILRDIGVQKTTLDTVVLRDNVTRSLADVLSQNSSIFIKSYGRATLSTASFRGTAPSHTQVTWNDMSINSPMLGMVDFSLIPSYLIDDADIYHGSSSLEVAGGGLGGAIALATAPTEDRGLNFKYVQGISSFGTYDEFFRATYSGRKWQGSTRLMYSDSENDFKYKNYEKPGHPTDRNKNGAFHDMHVLQEFYYTAGNGDRFNLAVWFMDSGRRLPMLKTDRREEADYYNHQKEQTLRAAAGWDRLRNSWKIYGRAGYTYTNLLYTFKGSRSANDMATLIDAPSYVHTLFGKAGADYMIGEKWLFTANASVHQHIVNTRDRAIMVNPGEMEPIGYKKNRADVSAFASVKYRPLKRLGLSFTLREELNGKVWAPIIPAGFAEYTLLRDKSLTLKTSLSRNYRYPTLNDRFYKPGGNPDLRPEKGVAWDAGAEYRFRRERISITAEATYYGSRIRDWILWIPSRSHWTPVNKKKVQSYGMELKGHLDADLGRGWRLHMDANYTISKSKNKSEPENSNDNSVGKQLVYIPEYSGAVTGKLTWKKWVLSYKYNYYSERFTSSDNDKGSITGRIFPYHMSDVSLERGIDTRWCRLGLKVAVNNIFDEEYESVLNRPMAGRNYGVFIEIVPKFRRKTDR